MLLTKSAWKTQDKMVTIREKYHHWTLEERKENADRLREEVMIKQKIRGLSNAPLTAHRTKSNLESTFFVASHFNSKIIISH